MSDSGLDQVEQASKQKPGSAESDCREDGKSKNLKESFYAFGFG